MEDPFLPDRAAASGKKRGGVFIGHETVVVAPDPHFQTGGLEGILQTEVIQHGVPVHRAASRKFQLHFQNAGFQGGIRKEQHGSAVLPHVLLVNGDGTGLPSGPDGQHEIRIPFPAHDSILGQSPDGGAESAHGVAPGGVEDVDRQVACDARGGFARGIVAQKQPQIGRQGLAFVSVPEEAAGGRDIQVRGPVLFVRLQELLQIPDQHGAFLRILVIRESQHGVSIGRKIAHPVLVTESHKLLVGTPRLCQDPDDQAIRIVNVSPFLYLGDPFLGMAGKPVDAPADEIGVAGFADRGLLHGKERIHHAGRGIGPAVFAVGAEPAPAAVAVDHLPDLPDAVRGNAVEIFGRETGDRAPAIPVHVLGIEFMARRLFPVNSPLKVHAQGLQRLFGGQRGKIPVDQTEHIVGVVGSQIGQKLHHIPRRAGRDVQCEGGAPRSAGLGDRQTDHALRVLRIQPPAMIHLLVDPFHQHGQLQFQRIRLGARPGRKSQDPLAGLPGSGKRNFEGDLAPRGDGEFFPQGLRQKAGRGEDDLRLLLLLRQIVHNGHGVDGIAPDHEPRDFQPCDQVLADHNLGSGLPCPGVGRDGPDADGPGGQVVRNGNMDLRLSGFRQDSPPDPERAVEEIRAEDVFGSGGVTGSTSGRPGLSDLLAIGRCQGI